MEEIITQVLAENEINTLLRKIDSVCCKCDATGYDCGSCPLFSLEIDLSEMLTILRKK